MDKAALKAQLVTLIDGDGGSESLAEAMILAATTPIDPPASVEPGAATAEGSRDETHDSIDPATGTLTAEAVAKRAADKAADDVAAAELEVAKAEEADDEAKLAEAKDRLAAAQARKDATAAALLADDVGEPAGDAGGAMVTVDPNDPAIQEPETIDPSFGKVNKAKDVSKTSDKA